MNKFYRFLKQLCSNLEYFVYKGITWEYISIFDIIFDVLEEYVWNNIFVEFLWKGVLHLETLLYSVLVENGYFGICIIEILSSSYFETFNKKIHFYTLAFSALRPVLRTVFNNDNQIILNSRFN